MAAVRRRERSGAGSGWLVGLIALAGGLAAPMATPVAGPLAAAERAADPLAKAIGEALLNPRVGPEIGAVYAARQNLPLWIERGHVRPEAKALVRLIETADEQGLQPSAYAPQTLRAAIAEAAGGETDALLRAELALSAAAAAYGADLHTPATAADLAYLDPSLPTAPRTRRAALDLLSRAPSLAKGLAELRRMSPVYERLRAAWAQARERGGADAALLRLNLERARAYPAELGRRYLWVDVAAQRLDVYEDGRRVDSMKVVVGRRTEPTPAMAAMVRYAVLRPYWNVPPDLVARNVAPKVLAQGPSYLERQRMEVLSDWTDQAAPLDPTTIDWAAVAAGRLPLRVRQLPGRDNMMGQVKFIFPNGFGVYLHDTPLRALFVGDERLGSAGCVRLEDAPRLARRLLGEATLSTKSAAGEPETRVDLSEPIPVYIAYFTVAPEAAGHVARRPDIYGRDAAVSAALEPHGGGATVLAAR